MSAEHDRMITLALGALLDDEDEGTYARRMLRARVKLGSATFTERLRYYLRLGPPRWMTEHARHQLAMRKLKHER